MPTAITLSHGARSAMSVYAANQTSVIGAMSLCPLALTVDTSVTGVAIHSERPNRPSTGTAVFSCVALTATILEIATPDCQAPCRGAGRRRIAESRGLGPLQEATFVQST